MEILGLRIKKLRENKKITQQELGVIIGLHGSNVGRIENGKVYPTSDVLLKICQYFSVSCDWLLTGEEKSDHSFCDYAGERDLLRLYRQLSAKDKAEIEELIEFKIERAKKGNRSNAKSSTLANDQIAK